LGAVLIAGSSTQCLLFAESPNVQPEVQLDGPDVVRKNGGAMFTAKVSDDRDLEAVRVQWFEREQTCPVDVNEAIQLPVARLGNTHTVTRTKEGAFCVGAIATDPQGASGFRARRFEVVNQPPVARLRMVAPSARIMSTGPSPEPFTTVEVPLHSEVRLSGDGSDDVDDDPRRLQYRWKVTAPGGAVEPLACGSVADGREICRRLTVAGDYMFELTVRDGQADSEMPAKLKVVAQPDALPCFERTEPPHDLARGEDGRPPVVITAFDRPYTFRVLEVRDDGDAYPTPSGVIPGSFSWQWRVPESASTPFERLTNTKLTSFTVEANSHRPGDEIEVRVDYRDSQPKEAYPCLVDNIADRCASPTNMACLHRVTWRLRFIQ
jgi:hypothetical protein